MASPSRITPFLWFDNEALEAAEFYVSVFPDSRITSISRYPDAGQEIHGGAAGSVMTVAFELDGQPFTALNGGPVFAFNESVSFVVACADQAQVDHYWDRLSEGGDPAAQQCGWLKDRFGLSWQVVPQALGRLMGGGDAAQSARVTGAFLNMKKLDIAELERAAADRSG
jgi:predicted 3-demethylubiquinone-9 3-methyltransferase (glyoxalase superfamily)